jgi:lysozyme
VISDRTSRLLRIGDIRKLILPSTSLTTVKLYRKSIESMQSQMPVTDIISQLERDEGLVLTTYIDTTGNLTIGYGHNLIANPIPGIGPGSTITQAQAFSILANDITTTYQSLVQAAPWIALFNPSGGQVVRRGVLLNMAFNLGVPGLLTFKNTLAAVKSHDYATAAADMANSLWASQVGARATRLETQMTSDLWT